MEIGITKYQFPRLEPQPEIFPNKNHNTKASWRKQNIREFFFVLLCNIPNSTTGRDRVR